MMKTDLLMQFATYLQFNGLSTPCSLSWEHGFFMILFNKISIKNQLKKYSKNKICRYIELFVNYVMIIVTNEIFQFSLYLK
jgi:hypothetical protein